MTTAAICATREVSSWPSSYRGEQYDPDLGLYYLRARYYNPATGRFLSRDPLSGQTIDPASLHKYLYAGGDPVNMIDPTGRDADAVESEELDATEETTVKFWTKDKVVALMTAAGACALYFNDLSDGGWPRCQEGKVSSPTNDGCPGCLAFGHPG